LESIQKKPNKFGLFEQNPGQRIVVYEGLQLIKKKGFNYIIKGRADSAILNLQPILNLAETDKNKLIFTQITSFTEPWLLGDCFMAGNINRLLKLWSPSKEYDVDGLIYFAKKLLQIERAKDLYLLILEKAFFVDMSELKIVDYRFNWLKNKKLIQKDKNYSDELLWGASNKWFAVNKQKLVGANKPNLISKRFLKQSSINKYKAVRLLIVFYRKLFLRIFNKELYKI